MSESAHSELAKVPLLGLDRVTLREALAPYIDRPFRVEQVYHALYEGGIGALAEISVLGKELRRELAGTFLVGRAEEAKRHTAADGTCKVLFRLHDGATVEAVDIPEEKRRTLCISSQAGCALACRFCVTGFWGAGRNLTAGEILAQILGIVGRLQAQESLNLVLMGMGEPLLNPQSVRQALEIVSEWVSWRRMTLSTVGVLPGLEAMMEWPQRPNLALSLHAPDDARRSQLMPVNRRFPLAEVLALLRRYPLERGRKITFEYVLIRDFNDAISDADALVDLVRRLGRPAKINLIPLNQDAVLGPDMVPPVASDVEAFRARLVDRGVVATVRRRRGDDVSAACGQLRATEREPRGFRRSNLSF